MSGMTTKKYSKYIKSTAIVFVLILYSTVFFGAQSFAAELKSRSVQISTSFASTPVEHRFSFVNQGASNVSSVKFEYCANSPLQNIVCIPPTSFDLSSFNLTSQLGITGFIKSGASNANNAIITRVAAVEPSTTSTYAIDNFNNPGLPNDIVYVRVSVYDGPDATGTKIDEGSVVFVVEEKYDISAYVPPYITFCVGVTVALDCTAANGFLANFGELSSQAPTSVSSQFSVATNDPDGYDTYINGQTLTSGNNTISALTAQTASMPGTSQFGVNLRANSAPSVGADPLSGVVASGSPDSNYNVANIFRFNDGDRLAGSAISTGYNRYTVSYVVNVPLNQPPGVYATTLTYTSIATF